MDPLFLLSVYERIQKYFRWLPNPNTNTGKKRIKVLIVGISMLILSFMVFLMAIKPEKIQDYGFVKGKIETVKINETRTDHRIYLSAIMELENQPGVFTYYFLPSEIGNPIRPKIGDSVELGFRTSEKIKGKGGTVREIRVDGKKLGGIEEYIRANNGIRRMIEPIVIILVTLSTMILTRNWIKSRELPSGHLGK